MAIYKPFLYGIVWGRGMRIGDAGCGGIVDAGTEGFRHSEGKARGIPNGGRSSVLSLPVRTIRGILRLLAQALNDSNIWGILRSLTLPLNDGKNLHNRSL